MQLCRFCLIIIGTFIQRSLLAWSWLDATLSIIGTSAFSLKVKKLKQMRLKQCCFVPDYGTALIYLAAWVRPSFCSSWTTLPTIMSSSFTSVPKSLSSIIADILRPSVLIWCGVSQVSPQTQSASHQASAPPPRPPQYLHHQSPKLSSCCFVKFQKNAITAFMKPLEPQHFKINIIISVVILQYLF